MTKVINTFTRCIMDKSTDKSLLPKDIFIDAENLRFSTSENNDGIGKSIKGTLEISNLTDGSGDYKCISAVFNKKRDTIIYLLASSNGSLSKIVEFDTKTGLTQNILVDTRGILKFNKSGYITGINIIDDLLIFSEWGNNIRRVNIEREKKNFLANGINSFNEDDITLIVKPPYNKPTIILQDTIAINSERENNIEEKFIVFGYRWRYLDGEYSAISPFTLPAFKPKTFNYDFSVQSNKSMINKYNQVLVGFNTGSKNVTEIQLIFKESGDNEAFIINDFDKELLGWDGVNNDTEKTFLLDNFNSIRGLSKIELRKLFDNVPRESLCQTIIDGRLVFSNYKENYNIVDSGNNKILIDYALTLKSEYIIGLSPEATAKSNRDYEVVIQYLDEYLRGTTLFKSLNNTLFIPNNLSVKKNTIEVLLKNKPPSFAKYFRFFVKQARRGYEQVLPITFYEDGVYVWVKLEESDIDKIKKGEFLIVKSDSQGNINTNKKAKVLEVSAKERNFLETIVVDSLKQVAGNYFKIKPNGFRLDVDDFDVYREQLYKTSGVFSTENKNVIHRTIFYTEGTVSLSETNSTIFSGNLDVRYRIEIDSIGDGITTFNTFKWSKDNGSSIIDKEPIQSNIDFPLENGVVITFDSNYGALLGDYWIISAKSIYVWSDAGHAYGYYRLPLDPIPAVTQTIKANSIISLTYDEYNDKKQFIEEQFISSKDYENLEEWYFEDNIDQKLGIKGIDGSRIIFRRGGFNGNEINISTNGIGVTVMIIRSLGIDNNFLDSNPKIKATIEVRSSENIIILETEPKEQSSDIFYEIGKTYKIENDFHLGSGLDDINQTISNDLKVKLDWFNAFAYGNGVESYKIKDEFNSKSIDIGTRVSSTSKEKYKEVVREVDVTWSDVYSDDASFNGLNSFNLSLVNFLPLDRENGSIQKLHNKNGNLLILQEDAVGRIPYNKNIIYDTQGGSVVGISTNVLNKESYFSYGAGKHGISKNPEGFVSDGFRDYFPDKQRGAWLRLSNDGITPISQNFYDHEFSNLMIANKNNKLVSGFDPKHKEILLHTPNNSKCLTFKESHKGFSNKLTFEPDFMIHANNEFYSWKKGVMYIHNSTSLANNFYGVNNNSKLKISVNHQFGYEKIFKALGIYSTHSWFVKLKTRLSSRDIPKESFRKINDYWYSEIMGDTSDNVENNSVFGIGSYSIVKGTVTVNHLPTSISVGDFVRSKTLLFGKLEVLGIIGNDLILDTVDTYKSSFLFYEKNQNIDGGNIKGDFMEVELTSNETDLVEIRAIKTEVEIITKE